MTFPASWPPRPPSGQRSIRFYASGTTSSFFNDNALMFYDGEDADTYVPLPIVKPGSTARVVVPNMPWGSGRSPGNPDPTYGSAAAPLPQIWSKAMTIANTGAADLEFSFDGTNVHGWVKAGTSVTYWDRFEAGICLRVSGGASTTYVVEAW